MKYNVNICGNCDGYHDKRYNVNICGNCAGYHDRRYKLYYSYINRAFRCRGYQN